MNTVKTKGSGVNWIWLSCLLLLMAAAAIVCQYLNNERHYGLLLWAIYFSSILLGIICAVKLETENDNSFWINTWMIFLFVVIVLAIFFPKKSHAAIGPQSPSDPYVCFCTVEESCFKCTCLDKNQYLQFIMDLTEIELQQRGEEFDPAVDGG